MTEITFLLLDEVTYNGVVTVKVDETVGDVVAVLKERCDHKFVEFSLPQLGIDMPNAEQYAVLMEGGKNFSLVTGNYDWVVVVGEGRTHAIAYELYCRQAEMRGGVGHYHRFGPLDAPDITATDLHALHRDISHFCGVLSDYFI